MGEGEDVSSQMRDCLLCLIFAFHLLGGQLHLRVAL